VAVGGSFELFFTVTNQGSADAGAFEMRVYLTTSGDVAAANDWSVYCSVPSLAAGVGYDCYGTLPLGQSVTPGVYYVVGVADVNKAVEQADRTGSAASASSGMLTVTKKITSRRASPVPGSRHR
jgi:hypothetical protein